MWCLDKLGTYKHLCGQIDRQIDGRTDQQTDRQTEYGQVTLPGTSSLTLVPLVFEHFGHYEPPDPYRNYQPGRWMMMTAIKMLKNLCVAGENDSQQRYNVAMLRLL